MYLFLHGSPLKGMPANNFFREGFRGVINKFRGLSETLSL
jgi:hypothetical protein